MAGTSTKVIASELNEQGTRHYLGPWTSARVQHVIHRLHRGPVDGVPSIPNTGIPKDRVAQLYATGLRPRAIAAVLNAEGVKTNRQRPVTPNAVFAALRTLGLRCPVVTIDDELRQVVEALGPASVRSLTRLVNGLGLSTSHRNSWTENEMARKLRRLGLRAATPRGRAQNPRIRTSEMNAPAGDSDERRNDG